MCICGIDCVLILYISFPTPPFLPSLPFSHSFQNILNAVRKITHNRTSIFIAHRLSTIVDADQILVLSEGKLIEQGTHGQLITNPSSYYAELWANQNRSPERART